MLRYFVGICLVSQIVVGPHAVAAESSNVTAQENAFAGDSAAVVEDAQSIRTLVARIEKERAAFEKRNREFKERPFDATEAKAIKALEEAINKMVDDLGDAQTNLWLRITFLEVAPGQVEARRKTIEKFRHERDKISRLLERLQDNSKWQAELNTWIKESEAGRWDAFLTIGGVVLGGLADKLEAMIEENPTAVANLARASQTYAPELEHMEATLGKLVRGSEERAALQATTSPIREIQVAVQKARVNKGDPKAILNVVKIGCRGMSKTVQVLRGGGMDMYHDFHRNTRAFITDFAKVSGGIVVSTMAAHKAEMLEASGKTVAAASIPLGLLALDAAEQFGRLWIVGNSVEQVLQSIDDLNEARARLGALIIVLTDDQKKLQTEMDRWLGRGKHSPEQIRKLLWGSS